eukprot:EG_transcript_24782
MPILSLIAVTFIGTANGLLAGLAADSAAQLFELECRLAAVAAEDCGCLNCRRTFRVAATQGALGGLVDTALDAVGVASLEFGQPVTQLGLGWFWASAVLANALNALAVTPLAFQVTHRPPRQFPRTVLRSTAVRFAIQLICFFVPATYWGYWLWRAVLPTAVASYTMFDGTRTDDHAADPTSLDCLRELTPAEAHCPHC